MPNRHQHRFAMAAGLLLLAAPGCCCMQNMVCGPGPLAGPPLAAAGERPCAVCGGPGIAGLGFGCGCLRRLHPVAWVTEAVWGVGNLCGFVRQNFTRIPEEDYVYEHPYVVNRFHPVPTGPVFAPPAPVIYEELPPPQSEPAEAPLADPPPPLARSAGDRRDSPAPAAVQSVLRRQPSPQNSVAAAPVAQRASGRRIANPIATLSVAEAIRLASVQSPTDSGLIAAPAVPAARGSETSSQWRPRTTR